MSDKEAQQQKDTAAIVVGIMAAAFFIWAYYNSHIFANLWRWVRFGELYLFQWIPAFSLPYIGTIDFGKAVFYLSSLSEYGLTYRSINRFDQIYAPFVGVPLSALLIWRGMKIQKIDPKLHKIFDMESMFKHYAEIYPHLQEIFEAHPEQKSLFYNRQIQETYRWGKMVNPKAFVETSPPFLLEDKAKENGTFNKAILDPGGIFDEDLAQWAFEAQLGNQWQGEDKLVEHERAAYEYLRDLLPVDNAKVEGFVTKVWNTLVKVSSKKPRSKCPQMKKFSAEENELMRVYWDVFRDEFEKVARIKPCSDAERSSLLVKMRSESRLLELCSDKKGRFKDIYRKIRASEVMSKHAYVYTGIMSMNQEACDGQRVTLTPVKAAIKSGSRQLWFALSSAGRRTSFPESGGIFAHWLMELDFKGPVGTPCVQEAVEALRSAVGADNED